MIGYFGLRYLIFSILLGVLLWWLRVGTGTMGLHYSLPATFTPTYKRYCDIREQIIVVPILTIVVCVAVYHGQVRTGTGRLYTFNRCGCGCGCGCECPQKILKW